LSASLRQRISDLEQELADTQRALDAAGGGSDPALELALAEEREKAEALASEVSRLTKLNEMAQAKIDAAHVAAQDQATTIGELTSKIGELQTLLEASMSTVKGLPERALRDKQAHSRLLAVVGQYDLFAAKEKRKV
jgi:chromosome segregation ATPase